MLFNAFCTAVKKYSDKLALNNISYRALYQMVVDRPYMPICSATDWTIILDILRAAYENKPIVILPKFRREEIDLIEPQGEFSIILYSSGSTGKRKQITMSEKMIMANAENAMACQRLTYLDRILTVCSLNHTGGISTQSLAGLLCGAHVIVEQFNPFSFFRTLHDYDITVTHLIPAMIDSLSKVKFNIPPKSLRLVMAGSDCVYIHHVEFWIQRDVNFIANYGLTEAGPIIINHEYHKDSDLSIFGQGVPLGTNEWCQTKIVDGVLWIKGRAVSTDDWFNTGDCVYCIDDWFVYQGRQSAGCKILPKAY
jgi:acyl-CoA synthetase (AMP-forming)/AMP-acid ligase II